MSDTTIGNCTYDAEESDYGYGVSYVAEKPRIEFVTNPKVARFKAIVDEMAATYEKKNHDYGDSFGISVRKYGLIAALTRMSDKFNRIENLILGAENKVPDESIMDSLKDLACYAVMTVMAIEDNNFEKVE